MDKQDELFVVVDQKDRVLGYRTRFDCHHNNQLIHRAIGIVIFNKRGEVLLQKRSKKKDLYPRLYTVSASGHVDKGETYLQTAKRELFEELGISSLHLKKELKFLTELECETEMDCLFSAQYEGPFSPNKEEIDEVKFVKPTQLRRMQPLLTPYAIINFKQLGIL